MSCLSRIFHVPSIFDYGTPLQFHTHNLPKIRSGVLGCLASMLRFGTDYLEAKIDSVWELQRASEDCPLGSLDPTTYNPWFWDTPPFVLTIFRNLRAHTDVILDAFRDTDSDPPPLIHRLAALAGPFVPTDMVSNKASFLASLCQSSASITCSEVHVQASSG